MQMAQPLSGHTNTNYAQITKQECVEIAMLRLQSNELSVNENIIEVMILVLKKR